MANFPQYKDVQDDQWGMSNFNWTLDTGTNYHILRTGCFPFMKYHCTKQAREDLRLQDIFYRAIKITNLGISKKLIFNYTLLKTRRFCSC